MPSMEQVGRGVAFGLIVGVIAYSLFFGALKKLSAGVISILSYFEIIATVIYGVLFFNELITWNMLLGAFCIIFSTWFIRTHQHV